MTKDEKARQKSLQRRAAKQKQRKAQGSRAVEQVSSRAVGHASQAALKASAGWPLHECLISRDWKSVEGLAQILVARQSPSGALAAGVFLVDLGCLGVKSAFASLFRSSAEYETLRQRMMSNQTLVHGDLDTAAKIVREGIAYAHQLGFEPDPDYRQASLMLAGANADASDAQVPLGKDGKPFFVAGPNDNPKRVIAKLTRAVGPGNFDYIVPLGPPPRDW